MRSKARKRLNRLLVSLERRFFSSLKSSSFVLACTIDLGIVHRFTNVESSNVTDIDPIHRIDYREINELTAVFIISRSAE